MNMMYKITSVRTPSGNRLGYQEHVGKVVKMEGNAYFGFKFKLPCGKLVDELHFDYLSVEETNRGMDR